MYSHSQISSFENCPMKYKFSYIDRIKVETTGIEAFLGSIVHDVLENLYDLASNKKVITDTEMLADFERRWNNKWHDNIEIVRDHLTPESYKQMGISFLKEYYQQYHPFDQEKLLALEDRIILTIGPYKYQGYIDRLCERDDIYEIHDYKTGGRLPTVEEMEKERQLHVYALAIFRRFPDAHKILLIWHYLKFNKEIRIEIDRKEAEDYASLVQKSIDSIEVAKENQDFPATPSALCAWCSYQNICPSRKHIHWANNATPNEWLNEDGYKLATKFAELTGKKKENTEKIDDELVKVREALLIYSVKNNVSTLKGKDVNVSISFRNITKTVNQTSLESFLKDNKLWNQASTIDLKKVVKIETDEDTPPQIRNELKKLLKIEKRPGITVKKEKS